MFRPHVPLQCALALTALATYSGQKNFLFIGMDDMRVQAHCYGQAMMKTPNMDRLAKRGMVFMNAYVQQAVCAASRASLLTGCRPDTTGVNYPYTPWFVNVFLKDHMTIPVFFAKHGFYTRTFGKIHHGPSDKGLTEPHFNGKAGYYVLKENQHGNPKEKHTELNKPWEHADLPDNRYSDGQVAAETIATIRRAAKSGKPFFLAPGFKKPHLPFVCPKKYYDMYTDADIRLSPHPKLGPNQDPITINNKTGALKWWKYPKSGIDDANARQLIHSYYACVSFVDAQIGKILDELDRSGLADSTVVMLWSDHGYHLGDHSAWGKATNYELATRSPLIVFNPGMKATGKSTRALVEYVDMYPTLAELAGLQPPAWLEGTSFAPLLDDPHKPWKKAAFSQFPRGRTKEGYTIRTANWRYTEWRENDKAFYVELYHTAKDPIETVNLAKDGDYAERIQTMRNLLHAGWKHALPPGVDNTSNNPRGDDSFYLRKKGKKKKIVTK